MMLCVLRVVGQEVQHLGDVHRGVRPERDHGREAHGVVAGPVEHRRGQRARLRHQRQRARRPAARPTLALSCRRGRWKPRLLGPSRCTPSRRAISLQLGGRVGTDAAGDHQRRAAGHAAGQLQRGRHLCRRQRDDGQVGARSWPGRPACRWCWCRRNAACRRSAAPAGPRTAPGHARVWLDGSSCRPAMTTMDSGENSGVR